MRKLQFYKANHSQRNAAMEAEALKLYEREQAYDYLFRERDNSLELFFDAYRRLKLSRAIPILAALLSILVMLWALVQKVATIALPSFRTRLGLHIPTLKGGASLLKQAIRTGVVFLVTSSVASAGIVGYYWPQVAGDIDRIDRNIKCSEAHVLIDRDGYAGALPVADCLTALAFTAKFPDDVAQKLQVAFSAQEGGVSREETILGQDLWGYFRWALSQVPFAHSLAEAFGMPFTRGGSSGFQTAAEFFHGSPHALSITEKPRMIVIGMRLAATRMSLDIDRAHLVSRLPAITGYGGRPIGGRHAAQILFGHDPKQVWELCLIAAAAGKPLHIKQDPLSKGTDHPTVIRARARAMSCIDKLADTPTQAEKEKMALVEWTVSCCARCECA